VEEGFEVSLEGKPRGHRPRVLNGEDEARLIALVCGPVPEGCARWTLRLLADAWVSLENTEAETVSRETIRRTLKKTNLNPGKTGDGAGRRKDDSGVQEVFDDTAHKLPLGSLMIIFLGFRYSPGQPFLYDPACRLPCGLPCRSSAGIGLRFIASEPDIPDNPRSDLPLVKTIGIYE
jgi:transposase